jgi:serine/threonine-protein phosphatase 4 regulatory subunit 1
MKSIHGFLESTSKSQDELNKHMSEIMLPILSYVLKKDALELKEPAGEIMSIIAEGLSAAARGELVLPVILEMAHDELSEENRVVAIQLLSKLAKTLGADLCEHFIGFEILALGEDPATRVRKECVANLEGISKVVNQKFVQERFLPFFVKMAEDPAWIVRKAVVEAIVPMSAACGQDPLQQQLVEIMKKLLKDSNKWVKVSGYKNLGPFIHTLKDFNAPLLDLFVHMTDPTVNNLTTDNEVHHFLCVLAN